MKLSNFSIIRYQYKPMTVVVVISMFFFNCSDIYLASWNCVEDGDYQCEQVGDVGWLDNRPVDVLIVIDTSEKGQELNPHITSNLSQFLRCMKPVGSLRVGVTPGVARESSTDTLGELMNLEMDGEMSVKKFVTPDMRNYETVFSDTVSLKSGCSYPPYCNSGARRPLSAIRGFMQKQVAYKAREDRFLREYASLATIVVSISGEKKGVFSKDGINAQEALASVYEKYSKDEFIGLVVTDSGDTSNCIQTIGKTVSRGVSKGLEGVSKVGTVYNLGGLWGWWSVEPTLALGSQLLNIFLLKKKADSSGGSANSYELVEFAEQSGGHAFDICKPSFGIALAYSVLQKIDMEGRFPDECKQFGLKQQMAELGSDFNE